MNGVVVVALDDREHVTVLRRQYAMGLGAYLTLPGGASNVGEADVTTAERVLRSKTGIEASKWTRLGSFLHATDCPDRTTLCLGEGLRYGDAEEVTFDKFDIDLMPLPDAIKSVMSGDFVLPTSALALMMAERLLNERRGRDVLTTH
ncbi:NUDIX domain-containing protein [Streptomyces sp. NPDC088915]|uniref:NUDIX domain-containing protein n=1 Tax=Streptomyces sp. NPDC088915 TaxID=3365912 RepID=UPI0038092548